MTIVRHIIQHIAFRETPLYNINNIVLRVYRESEDTYGWVGFIKATARHTYMHIRMYMLGSAWNHPVRSAQNKSTQLKCLALTNATYNKT